jgi:hypothetical protein
MTPGRYGQAARLPRRCCSGKPSVAHDGAAPPPLAYSSPSAASRSDSPQPEAVAIAELDKVLGSPTTPRPAGDAGNCTVDAYLTWPTMTAYFFHGRFVGYNSASLLAARVPVRRM